MSRANVIAIILATQAVETTAHVAATLHFSFLARVMGEFLFNLHDVGDGGVLALR
eukprot:m.50230 g.50230  ORF g.50230 m.50230 type:complete len:55 (+) comp11148_c0_seq4:1820-1984(+)